MTLLPISIIYLLMHGEAQRAKYKGVLQKRETEGERARCSICNNLRHSITLLPKSIIYLLKEKRRERHGRGT